MILFVFVFKICDEIFTCMFVFIIVIFIHEFIN